MSNHDAFIRDALDLMKQMRGDDDAVPPVPIGAKRFGQGGYAIGIQSVLRLVEEQEPRMRHKGETQLQTLLHTRRIVLRLPSMRRVVDAHIVQRRLRVHVQTPERGDHLDVLPTRQVGKETGMVYRRGHLVDVRPGVCDLPAHGPDPPEQRLHQRGLTRAVRPEQTDDPTRIQPQVDVTDNRGILVPNREIGRRYNWHDPPSKKAFLETRLASRNARCYDDVANACFHR